MERGRGGKERGIEGREGRKKGEGDNGEREGGGKVAVQGRRKREILVNHRDENEENKIVAKRMFSRQ